MAVLRPASDDVQARRPTAHVSLSRVGVTNVQKVIRIRADGAELSFISTATTFGTAVDVTVSELSIESFFPADDATAAFLQRD